MVGTFRALTIQSGITTQVQDGSTLIVGLGIDTGVAQALSIGSTTATAVNIAAAGVTTTVDGYLTVVQAATLSSTLAVTGTSTFGAKLTVTAGGAAVTGGTTTDTLASTSTATFAGNTSVTGTSTFTVGTGATSLGGTLAVTGTSTFTGEATFNAATGVAVTNAATVGTTLVVGTGLTVSAGGAAITGDSTVTGTFHVTSTSNLDGYVTAGAGVGVAGGLTVSGATTLTALTPQGIVVNSSSGVLSTSVGTDKQILQTESGVPTWVTVSGDGYLADGGALTVQSAAGNFLVNGNLTVDGTSALVGATTVTGLLTANGGVGTTTLSTSGLATLSSASVTNNATVGGTLTVSSDAYFNGAGTGVAVQNNATVGGTLGVTGNTSLSTVSTSSLATLNSASVTTTLGVTGAATLSSTLAVTEASTLTGGALSPTFDAITAGALTIGGTNATSIVLGKTGVPTTADGYFTAAAGANVEGGLTVTGGTTTDTLSVSGAVNLHLGEGVVISSSGSVLSATNGSVGQLFIENSGATAGAWTTVTGDAYFSTVTPGAITVTALQGNPVASGTLTSLQDGYVLSWNGTEWYAESPASALIVTLNGDVTGPSDANTVVAINHTTVPASPSAAQILIAQSGTSSLWETVSQDATLTAGGVLTVVSANGSFTVGNGSSGNLTVKGTSSLEGTTTVTTGGLAVTGGTSTDTLGTTSLATLDSASVTTTLGVTGVSTLTGGTLTNSVDTIGGATLVLGGTNATAITLGSATAPVTVPGNFTVNGTETIIGTSVFQNPATFDNTLTVIDGYKLMAQTIQSNDGYLTLNGVTGTNLQVGGSNYLEIATVAPNTIVVPSGITLEAATGGKIIATGANTVLIPSTILNNGLSSGMPTYVSSGGVATATNASAIASSWFVGFSDGAGNTIVSGYVTTSTMSTLGAPVYLGTSAGTLTQTAPSTTGQVVAQVGIAVTATTMLIQVTTPVQL